MSITSSFRHELIRALVVCGIALGLVLPAGSAGAAITEAPSKHKPGKNRGVSQTRTFFRYLIIQGVKQFHKGDGVIDAKVIRRPLSRAKGLDSIFGPNGLGKLMSECTKPTADRASWAKSTYGKFANPLTDAILRASGDQSRVVAELTGAGILKPADSAKGETVTDWDHADRALTHAFSVIAAEYKALGGSL